MPDLNENDYFEYGKMYLEKDGYQLRYVLLNPKGELSEGLLDINLPESFDKDFLNNKKENQRTILLKDSLEDIKLKLGRLQSDKNIYELGKKVSEKEMDTINILEHKINPKWNYTLSKI